MSRLRELIDELCPGGVEYRMLGELTTKIVDGSHKVPPKSSNDDALPMISAQNIVNGKLDTSFGRYIEPSSYALESLRTRAQRDDVLLTIVGAIGRTAMVETDDVLAFQRSVCVITADKSCLDPRFLRHVLDSSAIQSYMEANARGAAQKGFYLSQVAALSIPVPPIEVQREIVRILDSFQELDDALTAEIEAREKQLRVAQEVLFNSLSDLSEPLGEHVRFINGRAYKKEELLLAGKYRVLRVGNFFSNDSWYYSDLELDADKYCHEGDLLYAWSASFGPRIWHGEKTIFHYHIWKLVFNTTMLDRGYLLQFLDFDSRRIKSSSFVTNSTMMHVSMAQMKKRLFPLPDMQTQIAVARKLNSITAFIDELRYERDARRKEFEHYRDKLLSFPEKEA